MLLLSFSFYHLTLIFDEFSFFMLSRLCNWKMQIDLLIVSSWTANILSRQAIK